MYGHLLRADLGATPAPNAAEGPHLNVYVFLVVGVHDQDYHSRGVAVGQPGDGFGNVRGRLVVGNHEQVEDAGAQAQRPVFVHAELAELVLYLLHAQSARPGRFAGLVRHGRRHS